MRYKKKASLVKLFTRRDTERDKEMRIQKPQNLPQQYIDMENNHQIAAACGGVWSCCCCLCLHFENVWNWKSTAFAMWTRKAAAQSTDFYEEESLVSPPMYLLLPSLSKDLFALPFFKRFCCCCWCSCWSQEDLYKLLFQFVWRKQWKLFFFHPTS